MVFGLSGRLYCGRLEIAENGVKWGFCPHYLFVFMRGAVGKVGISTV
nr:MAG TPA: hypothetical protein [Caudoviricetes sp.]